MSDPTSKLDKGYEQRADTSVSRKAWQELLDRHVTIPASMSTQAAEILRGFAGSWAASFELGAGGSAELGGPQGVPVLQKKTNLLGFPGMGEINFVPFAHNTHRFGPKGPSLLGHPISFEVVGPTLKAPLNDWQWRVIDNSATPGSGDQFVLDYEGTDSYSSRSNASDGALKSDLEVSGPLTIEDVYGFTSLGSFIGSALYLVVNMTGHSVAGVPAGPGGVGDGEIGDHDGSRVAIQANTPSSKTEVFRVIDASASTLTLDSSKRLVDYFTISGTTPVCRSILMVQPAATRLVAVPGSGAVGREQVFAVVPPERSLVGEYQPAARQFLGPWGTGSDYSAWNGYSSVSAALGHPDDYNKGVTLPVPIPQERTIGAFPKSFNVVDPLSLTEWGRHRIPVLSGHIATASDVGRVIYIHDVERVGGAETYHSGASNWVSDPGYEWLLGYHEVIDYDISGDWVEVRRIPELDPSSGVPFIAPPNALEPMFTTGDNNIGIRIRWTWQDPISTLWTDAHPSMEKLSTCRLTNIINPDWTRQQASIKSEDEDGELYRGHPDRSIFDTSSYDGGADNSNANPGNLLDLGFRMVLFPAKENGVFGVVPDFDNPITSREVVLDPSVDVEQWIDIDYSSGLVTLSRAPVPGAGCEIAPHGVIVHAENPRNEVVLFAACVPFSREQGQLGANPRVVAGQYDDTALPCAYGAGPVSADIHSERVVWRLADQTITSGTHQSIELADTLLDNEVPVSGYVELIQGLDPEGPTMFKDLSGTSYPQSTFGYMYRQDTGTGGGTLLEDCFGGAGTQTFTVDDANPAIAVLRRDIRLPSNTLGVAGTDYVHDVTYGAFKRASAIRMKRATLKHEIDGSITVGDTEPLADSQVALWNKLVHNSTLSGGAATVSSSTEVDITAAEVLFNGRYYQFEDTKVTAPSSDGAWYLYIGIDSTTGCPTYQFDSSGLPLPDPVEDILIATVVVTSGVVSSVEDLRKPIIHLDQRIDITVGDSTGGDPVYSPVLDRLDSPHFDRVSDAVKWVNALGNPTSTDSGSYSNYGRYFRILVVGPTWEDVTPIEIGVDGLIIEGVGTRTDGGSSLYGDTPLAVRWVENALFEFNGHSNLQFRNLHMEFWDQGQGVPSTTIRNCFQNTTGGVLSGIRVTDCVLTNGGTGASDAFAQTFIYCVNGTRIERWVIRGNKAFTTDAGIYFGGDRTLGIQVDNLYYMTIDNNWFEAASTHQTMQGPNATLIDEIYGGIILDPQYDAYTYNNLIQNNMVQFFDGVGIYLSYLCPESLLDSNQIYYTGDVGIFAGAKSSTGTGSVSRISLVNNTLDRVHYKAAGTSQMGSFYGWAQKRGLYLKNGNDCSVLNNWSFLFGSGSAEFAILMEADRSIASNNNCPFDSMGYLATPATDTSNIWADNQVEGILQVGQADTVLGCNTDGIVVQGIGGIVANSYARSSGITPVPGTLVANCYVTGNTGDASAIAVAYTGCAFIGDGTETLAAGEGTRFTGCAFSNMLFSLGIYTNLVACGSNTDLALPIYSRMVGCNFPDVVLDAHTLVSGCTFDSVELHNEAPGGGVVVSGNKMGTILSYAGKTSYDNTITGNRVTLAATCKFSSTTFTGNLFEAGVTIRGSGCSLSGNNITGTLTYSGYNQATIVGNVITSDMDCTSMDDYLIMGNRVGGALDVDAFGGVGAGILLGNRALSITSSGVLPSTYGVVLGNKVDRFNSLFGVAPGTDTVGIMGNASQLTDFNVTA